MRSARVAVSWLLAVAGACLVVITYRLAAGQEAGSRAGSEPFFAGLFVSLPFVALFLGQVAGALCATFAPQRVGHVLGLGLAIVAWTMAVAFFVRL